jgi:hypothetical protein
MVDGELIVYILSCQQYLGLPPGKARQYAQTMGNGYDPQNKR